MTDNAVQAAESGDAKSARFASAFQQMEYVIHDLTCAVAVMDTVKEKVIGGTRDYDSEKIKELVPRLKDMVISVNEERDFNAFHYAFRHLEDLIAKLQKDYFAQFEAPTS